MAVVSASTSHQAKEDREEPQKEGSTEGAKCRDSVFIPSGSVRGSEGQETTGGPWCLSDKTGNGFCRRKLL